MAGPLERFYLKYSPRLSSLRCIPLLGHLAHRASYSVLPPARRAWFRVSQGLGEGLWLNLPPRTGGEYLQGRVEPEIQEALGKYLRPGMVFYDLGANFGFFSLIAARLVGQGGKVYAFEADPVVALLLREHVERNRLSNVRVVTMAVWSSTGTIAFERADFSQTPDHGWGRVVSTPAIGERTLALPSTALDDFAPSESPPDLIKCDVEGAELEVFRGAQRLLASRRPLLLCEVHSDQNAARIEEILAGLNYSLRWLPHRHLLASPLCMAETTCVAEDSAPSPC